MNSNTSKLYNLYGSVYSAFAPFVDFRDKSEACSGNPYTFFESRKVKSIPIEAGPNINVQSYLLSWNLYYCQSFQPKDSGLDHLSNH